MLLLLPMCFLTDLGFTSEEMGYFEIRDGTSQPQIGSLLFFQRYMWDFNTSIKWGPALILTKNKKRSQLLTIFSVYILFYWFYKWWHIFSIQY
jgi:hypothetical protein